MVSTSEDSSVDGGWISWYCDEEMSSFLVEVDPEFASDPFNFCKLKMHIPRFGAAYAMMNGAAPSINNLKRPQYNDLLKETKALYALIHARYITSPRGLERMREKYTHELFGHCPRVYCENEKLLPIGLSDELYRDKVKGYCHFCQEVYTLEKAWITLDGAAFGTSFPHVFMQTYPELVNLKPIIPHIPKAFGFRIHGAKSIIEIKLENGEYGSSLIKKIRGDDEKQERKIPDSEMSLLLADDS